MEVVDGTALKARPPGIRRTGERARPLRHFVGRRHYYTSGRVQAGGSVLRAADGGRQVGGRRHALTAGGVTWRPSRPRAGDVDITKYPVLVSIGRGIQEGQENVPIAQELADAIGRGGELLASRG
jgi:hypothetical protein